MELGQYDYETNDALSDFLFNGDSQKILSTVAGAIYSHNAKYPERWIYAKGSTSSRTRLYQMSLNKYLDQIKNDFELFGFINGKWQEFQKNINYESFLAGRKN